MDQLRGSLQGQRTFLLLAPDGPQPNDTDEYYIVNWHTDEFDLNATATYRISVLVEGTELGLADVDVVNSGKDLKNVITGAFIPLKDGRTLPIKFRIEGVSEPPEPQPITIVNGRCELPDLGQPTFTRVDPPGWTVVLADFSNRGVWDITNSLSTFPNGPPEGDQVCFIWGASFVQTLTEVLAPNTTYTLLAEFTHPAGSVSEFTIELLAGGVSLSSFSGFPAVPGIFAPAFVVFNSGPTPAQEGEVLGIRISGTAGESQFDDVRLFTGPPPVVRSVVVTPSEALISEAGTQEYTVTVEDFFGAVVPGVDVQWGIDDATVASLDPVSGTTDGSGQHTTTATPAGALGTLATITATSHGVRGTATIEAVASGITVENGGCELPDLGQPTFTRVDPPGWTVVPAGFSNRGVQDISNNPSNFPDGPPEGDQVCWIWAASFVQTLTAVLAPNTTYTLLAEFIHPASAVSEFTIELLAGGVSLSSFSGFPAVPGIFAMASRRLQLRTDPSAGR